MPETRVATPERISETASFDSATTVWNLRFELIRNAAYHNDLLNFYSWSHRVAMFVGTVAGTTAFGAALGESKFSAAVAGLTVAVATTTDLVFALTDRARTHEILLQKFISLLSELERGIRDERQHDQLKRQMFELWENAPPLKYAALAKAWNTAAAATSRTEDLKRISFIPLKPWQNLFRHVLSYSPELLRLAELKGNHL